MGGSIKELAKIPFLNDIHFFVWMNDEPANCKYRLEELRKNPSEKVTFLILPLNANSLR
jgi:hypothetical protein